MRGEGRSRLKLSAYKTKDRTQILILVPTIKHILYFSHLLSIPPLSKISSTWLVAIVINIYVQQIEWWMHLGCRWSNKICQQEQPQFFFLFKKKKTLVICWCFSDPSLMGFSHTDDSVFFEHINLWREFGVVAWICPQDSSNKQSWIYAFYVEGKKHQQGMANFFSLFSSRFDFAFDFALFL